MTLPASIRVNVGAPFPSRVTGASFISVGKSNGIWKITPNYPALADTPILTATQVLAVFDTNTGVYSLINAIDLVGLAANVYRTVAGGVAVALQPTDVVLLVQTVAGTPTTFQLPVSATRNGAPLKFKDIGYNANTGNIIFTPSGAETIDGFDAADSAANGVAVIDVDGDDKTLYPLTSGGWYVG